MKYRMIVSLMTLDLVIRSAAAQTFPTGFMRTDLVASGLTSPTCCCIAPDGTIYVCQQGGTLRVWRESGLLATQFFANTPLTVNFSGERGLIGAELDPDFATNHYMYVYYTATTPTIHNRISRFTADSGGALAVAGSEAVLLDLNTLGGTIHNGGALHFGPDGELYAGVGENGNSSNAQSIANLLGKILRINPTPGNAIPTDNPSSFPGISGSPTGLNQAIWAVGVRNPFTFAFQPGTGRMFINDVGNVSWEEINDGIRGRNYGWPSTEGDFAQGSFPNFTRPVFTYPHSGGAITGVAIVGGTFYNPPVSPFPAAYYGQYFFGDLNGWIRRIDPASAAVNSFGQSLGNVVDIDVDLQGRLVYLTNGGRLARVDYTAPLSPMITTQPLPQSGCIGGTVYFSVTVAGSSPLTFLWRRNGMVLADGGNISGASTRILTIANLTPLSAGQYDCIVQNTNGAQASNPAALSVGGPGFVYDGDAIPRFATALLGHSMQSNDVCAFDVDRSGTVDAADLGGFIGGLLGD